MQALLNDIELDLQEIKYLIDAVSKEPNTPLRKIAKRSLLQMRVHVDALLQELENQGGLPIVSQLQEIKVEEVSREPEPFNLVPKPIDEKFIDEKPVDEKSAVIPVGDKVEFIPVLGERIRPGEDLKRLISLNDTFRFSRELFNGDNDLMNKVIQQIGEMSSMETAIVYLTSKIKVDNENETMNDFLELLKKYFKSA